MDKIKLVVVDEHTLAFIEPQTPGIAHVIRASVLKGSPHAEFGSFHHHGKVVRYAGQSDFDEYRVDFTGYKNHPDEYAFMDEPDVMGSFDQNGDTIGAASDDAPGFVVITTGDDVDRIDELFDPSESNATEVTPDDVVKAIHNGGKVGLMPLYPMPQRMPAVRQTIEYPNDVTFDVVYSQFPGGQILRVTELLTPLGEWHSVTMYFTEPEIEFWTVAEAIQRLIDQVDARAFTLEIEDEHGRVKNPDFAATDLVANRLN